MQKHPQRQLVSSSRKKSPRTQLARRSRKPATPPAALEELHHDGGGFLTLLLDRLGWNGLNGLQQRKHAAGRPVVALNRGQLLAAILFHYTVTWAGTLGEHLFWLLGIKMTESNLSERRQALPLVVFEELLARVLRPLAKPTTQAFYRGLHCSLTCLASMASALAYPIPSRLMNSAPRAAIRGGGTLSPSCSARPWLS